MTPTDLHAGRALDIEVAKRVFGRKVCTSYTFNDTYLLVKGDPCTLQTIPCYSSNLQDAWKVVEKMRQDGQHGCACEFETVGVVLISGC